MQFIKKLKASLPNGTPQHYQCSDSGGGDGLCAKCTDPFNYFYKVAHQYPLTENEKLYAILGDVNPEYALKLYD